MPNLRLVVEVCHAKDLMAKDGAGASSPFVVVEFDNQKLRTKAKAKDLNPVWNEQLEFNVSSKEALEEESIEVGVYTARSGGEKSLGKLSIPCSHAKRKGSEASEMVIPYSLEKKGVFSAMFGKGKGEIYLKLYYYEPEAKKEGGGGGEKKKEGGGGGGGGEEKKKDGDGGGGGGGEEKKKDGGGGGGGGEKKKEDAKKGDNDAKKQEVSKPIGVTTMYTAEDPSSFDVKRTKPNLHSPKVVHDLVTQIEYLYVRIDKAKDLAPKDLNGSSDPYVEIKLGNAKATTGVKKQTLKPDWSGGNNVFAFATRTNGAQIVEITVWDKDTLSKDDFMGSVAFDMSEIPTRRPPDSPLASQWYKLEPRKDEKRVKGEIMLAVWFGTQADEAFPEAWQSDTGGMALNRSKVYISPKLWYLRLTLIEAQDLIHPGGGGGGGGGGSNARLYEVLATAQLEGPCQQIHTRKAEFGGRRAGPGSPRFAGGEILFVASEPFVDKLLISVVNKVSKDKVEVLGSVAIPLYNVPKRPDRKPVEARWYDLEKSEKKAEEKPASGGGGEKKPPEERPVAGAKFTSRIRVAASLDGGYHVLDETAYHTSDVRPTERRMWKRPMGVLELGILSASSLLPTKTKDGKGTADAYCIAKYGKKWIRTRTVVSSLTPQWHEQYTWDVFDPCTVLTVAVFDNHLVSSDATKKAEEASAKDASSKDAGGKDAGGKDAGGKEPPKLDLVVGKIRIRLSTLCTDRTYTHSYPLVSLERSGVKKKGELEIAVRFSCVARLALLRAYSQPLLPKLHYAEPLSLQQVQELRKVATSIQIHHLQRAEPPIRAEAVRYILDADSHSWSYRRTKATWSRFAAVFSGPKRLARWIHEIRTWRNRVATVLVILLYMILVCFPEQILPTLFLYICLIGAWHWRYQPSHPPHMDIRLSQAASTLEDELDEEFDPFPSTKSPEIIKMRYDRLRRLAGRIQTFLTDVVAQLERIHALLSWRDPRATSIFVVFSFLLAVVLYVVPLRVLGVLLGLYFFRPPRFRSSLPSAPMNFFRRLPALSDSII